MCPREIKYCCHVSKQGCTLPTLHDGHPRWWVLRWRRMETRNDHHLASSDCSYPGRSTPKRLRMRKHTKTAEMHIQGKTSESPDFPCIQSAKFLYLKCLILFVAAFVQLLNHVSFAAPWTIACQAPLSMGFPRQEYSSGLPFSSPGDIPNPGIEPTSPTLTGGFFTAKPPGKLSFINSSHLFWLPGGVAKTPLYPGFPSSSSKQFSQHYLRVLAPGLEVLGMFAE